MVLYSLLCKKATTEQDLLNIFAIVIHRKKQTQKAMVTRKIDGKLHYKKIKNNWVYQNKAQRKANAVVNGSELRNGTIILKLKKNNWWAYRLVQCIKIKVFSHAPYNRELQIVD